MDFNQQMLIAPYTDVDEHGNALSQIIVICEDTISMAPRSTSD